MQKCDYALMKQIIAVDIDDVLSFTARGFTEFSNQTWGTRLEPHDFNEDFLTMWQVGYEVGIERLQQFLESDLALRYEHDQSAHPVLTRLSKSFEIIAVTSRSQPLRQMTEVWLDERYPNIFRALYFSGIYDQDKSKKAHLVSKEAIYLKISPEYVIDDHLKHCKAAASLGIKTVLFGNYVWNQADSLPDGVTRCNDWAAVGDYFDAK